MLSAIILAGGLSSRMGTNKLLLPYEDHTIIEHIVENVCNAGLEEIIVVTGHESAKVRTVLKNFPVRFVHNANYATGITTSIQQGVKSATGDGYMICLGDMITITSKEYGWLKRRFDSIVKNDKASICLPVFNHTKGNPVVFSSLYKNKILQNTDMNGCSDIVQSNKNSISFIDMPSDHILQNVEYYADYRQLAC